MIHTKVYVVKRQSYTGRIRVRKVPEIVSALRAICEHDSDKRRFESYAAEDRANRCINALKVSREKNLWRFIASHGGTVANSYGYPAKTEASLIGLRWDGGDTAYIVMWLAEIPANKATLAAVTEACVPGARALFDRRFCSGKKEQARAVASTAAELVIATCEPDSVIELELETAQTSYESGNSK